MIIWPDRPGIFHLCRSWTIRESDRNTQIFTIQDGAQYVAITDDEAVDAFEYLSRIEGIIPAIESAHAIAYAMKLAPTMGKDKIIVVNVSGRGEQGLCSNRKIQRGGYS